MNNETETLDYEEYTRREIERLETVLDGLQELFKSQADPRVSDAILKAQTKLDKYRGFEGAPKMRTPEEQEEKSLVDIVNDVYKFLVLIGGCACLLRVLLPFAGAHGYPAITH